MTIFTKFGKLFLLKLVQGIFLLMVSTKKGLPQRVLIASSHALFGQGLRSLLQSREQADVEVIGVVSSVEEAMLALEKQNPDLVIVDYDDKTLNRDEFLARFVEGEKKLRVVLLSLNEAQDAVVYDRRTLAASQIDDWLEEWNHEKTSIVETKLTKGGSANGQDRRNSMKHFLTAGILVVVVTALLIFGMSQVRLLPVDASAQAKPIDQMFRIEFIVIAFLFSLIVVLMVYSIVVFRRKKGDTSDAKHIEGNTRLEVVWTAIPLMTVLVFAYLGSWSLGETTRADPKPLEVNVIGSQWVWRFEYPALGIVSNELRLPVDKQALLHLWSTDVIHSFWVPEFRVKQDALPGGGELTRDLRITPTMLGEYKVRCAELCGLKHSYMEAPVIVMATADYDAWVAQQTGVSADPVERGQKWYTTYGCNACHSLDGTAGVGPSWKGIYGEQVTFTDGTSVTVDDNYLYESIRNPGSKIVKGFQNLMPANVAADMSDDKVNDVIRFIESLK
jgi:cytochrome c oxidase subunit 2